MARQKLSMLTTETTVPTSSTYSASASPSDSVRSYQERVSRLASLTMRWMASTAGSGSRSRLRGSASCVPVRARGERAARRRRQYVQPEACLVSRAIAMRCAPLQFAPGDARRRQ